MATLRQKRRGDRWFLDYRDVDGERYRIDTGTRDKKVAELWLRKAEDLTAQARLGVIKKIGRLDADVIAGREKKKPSLTALSPPHLCNLFASKWCAVRHCTETSWSFFSKNNF